MLRSGFSRAVLSLHQGPFLQEETPPLEESESVLQGYSEIVSELPVRETLDLSVPEDNESDPEDSGEFQATDFARA